MKQFKGAIIGFVAGILVATATGAYAAAGDQVQAIFADFNFIVNGKSVTPSETPLVYNGSSYLPVRSVANILGYDVTYKSDSRTIVLNNGTVTGSTYGTPPAPAPIITPVPAPSPVSSPSTSVVSSSSSGGSVGLGSISTVNGGNQPMRLKDKDVTGDLDNVITYNGTKYIDMMTVMKEKPDAFFDWDANKVLTLYRMDTSKTVFEKTPVVNNVPYIIVDVTLYIDYQFYLDNVANQF